MAPARKRAKPLEPPSRSSGESGYNAALALAYVSILGGTVKVFHHHSVARIATRDHARSARFDAVNTPIRTESGKNAWCYLGAARAAIFATACPDSFLNRVINGAF